MRQTARGDRQSWKDNQDLAEEAVLRSKVLSTGSMPFRSLEKAEFLANRSLEDVFDERVETAIKVPLEPGTFVEVRRYASLHLRFVGLMP